MRRTARRPGGGSAGRRVPAARLDPATGRLAQSEARFQRQVVELATLYGWAMQHDRATNQPLVCSRCSRLNRVDGGKRRARYACPTCLRPSPNIRNDPGWPDWWFVRAGRVVVAELKSDTGRVKPEQRQWLDLLATCPGLEVHVWRPADWAAVVAALEPATGGPMHKTIVSTAGAIDLGPAAERLGFVPGTPVDVIATRAGSLIVAVDDSVPIEAAYRPALPSDDRTDTVRLTAPSASSGTADRPVQGA